MIAVHKPSGLLVHRSLLDRHETRFAVQLLRDQIGRHVFPVHRLDKGTSGVLLFGLDRETAARLGNAFETRSVAKHYLAIVRGHPPEAGVIDHPLSRRYDDVEFRSGDACDAPQPARTSFRRLATVELPHRVDRYPTSRYALLALTPHTGRRHQLRRHLKHAAHPIIGDATYGKGRHNRLFAELFGTTRLLLACTGLRFRHPHDGSMIELACEPAADFMHVVGALGWTAQASSALAPLPDAPLPDARLSVTGDS